MSDFSNLSGRKKEHLEICSDDSAAFINKSAGFELYDFIHEAAPEFTLNEINVASTFFGKDIRFPFFISSMTGGNDEINNINIKLATAAEALNLPLGIGSLRYALETDSFDSSLRELRLKAPNIPIFGNIGAAQLVKLDSFERLKKIASLFEADAFAVHLNPVQELIQRYGEPDFSGIYNAIERLINELKIPIIVKEVGSGISAKTAQKLIDTGVQAIDVAGAGGTSWAKVELLRNKDNKFNDFSEWGLPTTYCLRTISQLKRNYSFKLISSGGVYTGLDIAKSLALGADLAGAARPVLQALNDDGINGVITFVEGLFNDVKMVFYLTGSKTVEELRDNKIISKRDLY